MEIIKSEKLVANLHDKRRICYAQKKFKTSIESWISIEKVHRVIKFNQETWLKPSIDWKSELTKRAKNNFKINFFKFMIISTFGDITENRKQRYQACKQQTRNKLFSFKTKLLYNKTFLRKFISHRNEKTQIFMNLSLIIYVYQYW